jgi:hypothetical protein
MCLASHFDDDITNCFCDDKFRGSLCQIDIEAIDECAPDPCVRGTCVDQYAAFLCRCPAGYQGTRCEIKMTPGTFGPWSEWGACSKTCDNGVRMRTKPCLLDPCLESNIDTDNCQVTPCASKYGFVNIYVNVNVVITIITNISSIIRLIVCPEIASCYWVNTISICLFLGMATWLISENKCCITNNCCQTWEEIFQLIGNDISILKCSNGLGRACQLMS